MIALMPYPGSTPPVDASHRITSPFTDVRIDRTACCRSSVSSSSASRNAAQFRNPTAKQTMTARSTGMACAARDDDSGQEPQDRGRGRGDAETGQALGAARDLIPPLQSVVAEAERDRTQGIAARLELARITALGGRVPCTYIGGPRTHGESAPRTRERCSSLTPSRSKSMQTPSAFWHGDESPFGAREGHRPSGSDGAAE